MTDDTFAELAKIDWVTFVGATRLHAMGSLDDPELAEEDWSGYGLTVCGRRGVWLSIPGILSRLGARRCQHCCRLTGLPQGVGSPKNDDACRQLMGLEVDGGARS